MSITRALLALYFGISFYAPVRNEMHPLVSIPLLVLFIFFLYHLFGWYWKTME